MSVATKISSHTQGISVLLFCLFLDLPSREHPGTRGPTSRSRSSCEQSRLQEQVHHVIRRGLNN